MTAISEGPARNLVGYGEHPPAVPWPDGARLAVSVVVNYEEGSERSMAMGDPDQEQLTEWGSYPFPDGVRNLAMESMNEYGSRAGIWRLLRIFEKYDVKTTFYACAVAFEQAPELARAAVAQGHEICSHGYRWEEVFRLSKEEEREHIRLAIASFERTTGARPVGWYCRYGPSVHTRELVVEEGGFLYDSDSYNDDLPFFVAVDGKRHLVIPYTPDVNDFNFWIAPGFITGRHFFEYLKETFDMLYAEGETQPKMMSIGLHPRIVGRPARALGLQQFIEYAKGFGDVWFATRQEIAQHWIANAPA